MKSPLTTLLLCLIKITLSAQDLYFPPVGTDSWQEISIDDLGWNSDYLPELEAFLSDSETKGFIVLKDGEIAVETYFDDHTQDSVWYWASAAKTLTAFEVGLLQQEGLVDIEAPTAAYLGGGWTTCATADENLITVRDQLSMTTGLNYDVAEIDCTDPACLACLNTPGSEWYYHNAPYTLLGDVIKEVTGRSRSVYTFQSLGRSIGLTGLWLDVDFNRVFFSTARVMARFGLLMLADGTWDGTTILSDTDYLQDMRSPSQDINPSYGYLWWLNTGPSFRLPSTLINFSGKIIPEAKEDIYMALGRDSQILIVDPSRNIVIVRMGADPDQSPVPIQYLRELWSHVDQLTTTTTSVTNVKHDLVKIWPNPTSDYLHIDALGPVSTSIICISGDIVLRTQATVVDIRSLPAGTYVVEVSNGTEVSRNMVSLLR